MTPKRIDELARETASKAHGLMAVHVPAGRCPLPHDGFIEHVVCEGSREHVVFWDTRGTHCSEPRCELNRTKAKETSDEN